VDTRNKVLSAREALAVARRLREEGKTLKLAVGYFDPVLAAHARRLKDAREGAAALAVVIADPPRPILPSRARAELVAALDAADYVVLPGDEPLEGLVTRLNGAEVLRGETADLELTKKLIQHVHTRQRAI
jgi:bifunctional ADP-heptose synthase (sugar kinase/adenylyltransferase)